MLTRNNKNRNAQTLAFFCILEILLGTWMFFPNLVSINLTNSIQNYLPLWVLSSIFLVGGIFNLFWTKNFWSYTLLVSTPITFLGIVFFQNSVVNNNIAPGTILCGAIGLYSAILIGQTLVEIKREST